MYRLNLLGAVALTDDSGRSCNSDVGGTKHLALLVYLVLEGARHPLRRDKVVGLLWPESGQEKARQSLSQALYKLRTALGDVVISDGQEELSLDRNLITSDCFEFAELAASGRLDEAVALYRGDVATGFNVKDASDFDQWLSHQQTSWRHHYAGVLLQLFDRAIRSRDLSRASVWAEKLIDVAPDNEAPLRTLLPLLRERGQSAAAKRLYEKYERTLAGLYETTPSPEIATLVENLPQPRRAPPRTATESVHAADPVVRRRGSLASLVLVAGVVVLVALGPRSYNSFKSKASLAAYVGTTPKVAVLPFAHADAAQRSASVLNEALQWRLRSVGFQVLSANGQDTAAVRELVRSGAGEITFLVGGDVATETTGSVAARLWLKEAGSGKRIWESRFTQPQSNAHLIATQLSDAITTEIRRVTGSVLELASGAERVSAASWQDVYRARERMQAAVDMRWQGAVAGSSTELKDAELTLVQVAKREQDWALPWVLRAKIAEARAFSTLIAGNSRQGASELDRGIRMLDSVATRLESEDVYEMRGYLQSRRVTFGVDDVATANRLLTRAESDLRKALTPGRDLSGSYAALSGVMYMQGKYAEAFVYARRAYDSNVFLRSNEEILVRLFSSALHAGDDQAADRWCQELQKTLPRQWPAVVCRIHLAGFAPHIVDVASLEGEIASLVAPPPVRATMLPRLNAAYALTLAQVGRADSARAALAAVADSKDPEVTLLRAFTLATLKDASQAHSALREYLAEYRGTRSMALHMRWLRQRSQTHMPLIQ